MKILYFSKGLMSPQNAPQKVSREIIDQLNKLTDEFDFYFVTDKRSSNENGSNEFQREITYYLNTNIPIPQIPLLSFEWENFLSFRVLKSVCEIIKPDLVHIHGYDGYYPAPPSNYKSLITFHDFPPMLVYDRYSFGPSRYLLNICRKRAQMIRLAKFFRYDYYHALSSEIAYFLEDSNILKSRIFVIPNGTKTKVVSQTSKHILKQKLKENLSLESDSKILTMIGKISDRKGIHFIKEVLPDLPHNYHLLLVGNRIKIIGSQYLKAIKKGKSSDRIHFLGYQTSNVVNAILSASDCLLSLSTSEACQLSPIESINARVPVIITDCGAAKDIFGRDYELLLPIPLDINILKDKIIDVVENQSKYISFDVNKKTWMEVAIMVKNMYNKINNGQL